MTPPVHVATADDGVPETEAATAHDEVRLMDHAYDGIREYDNPLPGWWRAIFWATIVFAAGYWVWFHVTDWGRTPEAGYQAALGSYEEKRELRERAEARNVSEDVLARVAIDPKVAAQGSAIFATRCASCHADDGRGLIGPNLTDLYQMHGSTRMDTFKTVKNGVPGTAMLAWGEQLAPADVIAVTAYVVAMRGQNIAGKEPQGAPVEPFR
jgi:cytochrome c oxidase cbb3-type subunit III